jgi:hypothetical protein
MVREVFCSPEEKNILYNRLFNVVEHERDPKLRRKLSKAFDRIRKANRDWDVLTRQAWWKWN